MTAHRRNSHKGKVRFRTLEKAATVAQEYNDRVPLRYGDLEPYPCRYCARFHVGHTPAGRVHITENGGRTMTTKNTVGVRCYFGQRTPRGPRVEAAVDVGDHDEYRDLALRLDLADHSPTGFEWGYGGSGPSQLALALLADFTGDDAYALARYTDFKWWVVAALPWERWTIPAEQMREWVDAHPLPAGDRAFYGGC